MEDTIFLNTLSGGDMLQVSETYSPYFMDKVDYWEIYDNSEHPRKQIACGGKDAEIIIYEETIFNQIKSHVK